MPSVDADSEGVNVGEMTPGVVSAVPSGESVMSVADDVALSSEMADADSLGVSSSGETEETVGSSSASAGALRLKSTFVGGMHEWSSQAPYSR